MKKPVIVITVFVLLITYYRACVFLKNSFLKTYESVLVELDSYSSWGLDTFPFVRILSVIDRFEKPTSLMTIPFRYRSSVRLLSNVSKMTEQAYATAITREKNGLDSRLSYIRNRIVDAKQLPETYTLTQLKELQRLSGLVFEANPTLVQIGSASASVTHIDEMVSGELERIEKDAIFSEIKRYEAECSKNLQFFSERNSQDGVALANACITQIDRLLDPTYRGNGALFLRSLVRERIYSAFIQTDQKRNRILQEEIFAELEKRKLQERLTLVPPAAVTSGKVVVVNIDLQRLYAYENGTSLFTYAVPITTGKQGFETVKGEFTIYSKQMYFQMTSPFPGIYYDNVVTYWMPFYLGYGLHDASWRSIYGTQDYPSVGSHGCVNIPFQEVAMLYNWAEVGTKVYVY